MESFIETYSNFLKSVHKHIPKKYFRENASKEPNASIIEHHQFLHILKDAPFVIGIFNNVKMGYEFISPNIKDIIGYEAELFIGEDGMQNVLSTFKAEHAAIFNNFIFPAIFDSFERRAPYKDVMDFRYTASFEVTLKDGSFKWFIQQINVIEIDHDGFPLLTLISIIDISGIKKDAMVDFIIAQKKPEGIYTNIYAASYTTNEIGVIFTEREIEIISLLALGKSSKEIAEQLFISIHTVNNHRKNMLAKAQLKNTNGLIQMATERRFI